MAMAYSGISCRYSVQQLGQGLCAQTAYNVELGISYGSSVSLVLLVDLPFITYL